MRAPHLILATLLTTAVLALLALLPGGAGRAEAAGYGPGFDVGDGRIGAYVTPQGTQAYCLEILLDRPLGVTDWGTVGGWGSLGRDELARLNFVINTFGQSADPVMTAAVNLFVWSVADPGTYNSHGMSGDDYYGGRAGGAAAAVKSVLASIRAQAAGVQAAGSAEVTIELDDTMEGRITVSADPASASGTLSIDGAVIAGGETTSVGVTGGSVIDIVATPDVDAANLSISASVEFHATPPLITVHASGPAQHIAGPGPLEFSATDRLDVRLDFAPMLVSQVTSARLAVTERPIDRLTVSLAADSPAPWRLRPDGTPVPVLATGTLYGPFPTAPVESEAPPTDAPIAWSEVVELVGEGDVDTSGDFVATSGGFYTWVWQITAEGQPEAVLVEGYEWQDRFGLASETFEAVPELAETGTESDAVMLVTGSVLLVLSGALLVVVAGRLVRSRAGRRRAAPPLRRVLRRP